MVLLLQRDYFLLQLSQLIYIQKNWSPEKQQQQAVIIVQAAAITLALCSEALVALNPFLFAHHLLYHSTNNKASFICVDHSLNISTNSSCICTAVGHGKAQGRRAQGETRGGQGRAPCLCL